MKVLEDPSSGLTYTALSGARKQSVEDVERLFGPGVITFMERNGYHNEAKYLTVVHNWRRSVDKRGLSDQQWRQFRDDFISGLYSQRVGYLGFSSRWIFLRAPMHKEHINYDSCHFQGGGGYPRVPLPCINPCTFPNTMQQLQYTIYLNLCLRCTHTIQVWLLNFINAGVCLDSGVKVLHEKH